MSIPEEDAEARGVPLSLFLVLAPPSRVGEAGGLSSSLGLLLHLLFFPTGVAPLQPADLVTNTYFSLFNSSQQTVSLNQWN